MPSERDIQKFLKLLFRSAQVRVHILSSFEQCCGTRVDVKWCVYSDTKRQFIAIFSLCEVMVFQQYKYVRDFMHIFKLKWMLS